VIVSDRGVRAGLAAAVLALVVIAAGRADGEEPALTLRATVAGAATATPVQIEVLRWSTDGERAPLLAALAPPPPAPAPAAPAAGGRGGRGRGGRGNAAPLSAAARFTAAVKAAPTVGFIWGDGPTGYALKYAWRAAAADGQERIVLVADRRVGAHATSWPSIAHVEDADFTLIELRLDARGSGVGKAVSTPAMTADAAAQALGLDGYATVPVLFEVRR
jgi:hypothetical protein